MNTPALSQSVIDRIDGVAMNEPGCLVTSDRLYELLGQLERAAPDFHDELQGALTHFISEVQEACWRDGWNCGRNPDLLVMAPAEPEPEPAPFEWVAVPGAEGVAIALTADEVVGRILGGAK